MQLTYRMEEIVCGSAPSTAMRTWCLPSYAIGCTESEPFAALADAARVRELHGMTEHQVTRRPMEAARRAIAERDQLRLGKVVAEEIDQRQISTADLASLAADLGCSLRSLRYAASTYRLVTRLRLTDAEVREIGWTKLVLVASGASDTLTKAEVVAMCEGRTVAEVRAASAGVVGSVKVVAFSLNKAQRRELEAALVRYGAVCVGRGLTGKEAALMRMVSKAT